MFMKKNIKQESLCKRVVDDGIILSLIDGELTPEQENFWLEHIRNCRECLALAADVVWTDAGMRSLSVSQKGRKELDSMMNPQLSMPIEKLKIDEELPEDLLNESGEMLLAKGTKITHAIIDILMRRGVKQVRLKQEEKPPETEIPKIEETAKQSELPIVEPTRHTPFIETLEPESETAFISQDFREGFFFAGEITRKPKFHFTDYAKFLGRIPHREAIKEETKRQAFRALVNSFDLLHNNMPVNLEEVREAARDVVNEILADESKTVSLLDMLLVSSKIYSHSFNTLVIFTTLCKSLNFDKNDILSGGEAALMHDIGRVLPRRDDEHGIDLYRNHPMRGYRFLMKQGTYNEKMLTIVLNHHERFDGLGFPRRVSGDKLGLLDQLLIVANRYDQAITDPIHDVKRDFHRAAQLIYQSPGILVAPEIVNAFLNVMGIYPPGSYVKLKSGEEGIVREANYLRPFQPKITLIRTSEGRDLTEPIDIDLRELENNSIERCLDVVALLDRENPV